MRIKSRRQIAANKRNALACEHHRRCGDVIRKQHITARPIVPYANHRRVPGIQASLCKGRRLLCVIEELNAARERIGASVNGQKAERARESDSYLY